MSSEFLVCVGYEIIKYRFTWLKTVSAGQIKLHLIALFVCGMHTWNI